LKASLTKNLICPKCSQRFAVLPKKKTVNEIIEGFLICSNKHKVRITKGIPRFVFDNTKDFVKTEDAFSSKWKNYNKSYHQKKWFDIQKKWFLTRFGWKTYEKFVKFLKTRNWILDAGTGVGNSAKLFSANPKSQVFAIDASESIEFAYKKYGKITNIHFLQADIRNLPFKRKFFDFICSDQVLHHTRDTKTSFNKLTGHLKKNGVISIYVYKIKGPIREFADDYIRNHTVKMNEKDCMEFSRQLTELGRSLSKLKQKIKISKDIPILKIKAGTYDVQRFFYWNFLKCWWSDDVPFEQSVATNFDWYFPKFAYRHTPEEVKKWYKNMKIRITHFNEIESGISVNGKKTV